MRWRTINSNILFITSTEEKIINPGTVLTGIQEYEPGQLTLVAVLAFQDKKIAMLEEDSIIHA